MTALLLTRSLFPCSRRSNFSAARHSRSRRGVCGVILSVARTVNYTNGVPKGRAGRRDWWRCCAWQHGAGCRRDCQLTECGLRLSVAPTVRPGVDRGGSVWASGKRRSHDRRAAPAGVILDHGIRPPGLRPGGVVNMSKEAPSPASSIGPLTPAYQHVRTLDRARLRRRVLAYLERNALDCDESWENRGVAGPTRARSATRKGAHDHDDPAYGSVLLAAAHDEQLRSDERAGGRIASADYVIPLAELNGSTLASVMHRALVGTAWRIICDDVAARSRDYRAGELVRTLQRAIEAHADPSGASEAYGAAEWLVWQLGTLAYHARRYQSRDDRPDVWQDLGGTYAEAFIAWFDLTKLLTPAIRGAAQSLYSVSTPPIKVGKLRPTTTVIEAVADQLGIYVRNAVYQDRRHPLEPGREETRADARERIGIKTWGDGVVFLADEWKRQDRGRAESALAVLRLESIDFDDLSVQLAKEGRSVLAKAKTPNVPATAISPQVPPKMPKTRRGLGRLLATECKDSGVIADLKSGVSYRNAAKRNGVSKTTVGRIAVANGLTGHAPDAVPLAGTLSENLSIRGKAGNRGGR